MTKSILTITEKEIAIFLIITGFLEFTSESKKVANSWKVEKIIECL